MGDRPDGPPARETSPGGAELQDAPTPGENASVPRVEGPKLVPVDQAVRDATLVAFRDDLLRVIRERDVEALLSSLDPNIRTSFGATGGVDDFRDQWHPEDPDSPVWTELETILSLGGTFNDDAPEPQFWAPYVYSAWPESHDPFLSLAVIDEDVNLHESSDAASPVIARLSYDIVTAVEASRSESDAPWRRVQTADGQEGWIRSDLVRSPVDYRIALTRSGQNWTMSAIVAGD